jgi:hypothetical protein
MQTLLDRERTPNWKYIWLYLYSMSYQLIDARGANAVKKVLVLSVIVYACIFIKSWS